MFFIHLACGALLPDTQVRPADVLIPHWTGGRDTALDVTVINPLQTELVRRAANKAGAALEVAFNRKMTQAGEACRREGIVFAPMPWETLGGWHEETVEQVKKLASAQARQTGEEQSEATRHLYQKLPGQGQRCTPPQQVPYPRQPRH